LLLVANIKQFSLKNCLQEFAIKKDKNSKKNIKFLIKYIREFINKINCLFFV